LAITEFEEKYTEATVDKILEEIWMSPVDRELYKNLILVSPSQFCLVIFFLYVLFFVLGLLGRRHALLLFLF
jgi:hypothetical protein